MFSKIKKLLGQSAVYGFGLMGTSIAYMVLTPIFLHRLNGAEYGVSDLLNTFTSMLYSVMLLGIASVLIKIYITDCQTLEERRTLVSTMVVFTAIVGLGMWLVTYAISSRISIWLFKVPKYGYLVQLATAGSSLLVVQQMALLCLRARQKPWSFAVVSLSQLVVVIGCNLYFVWHRGMGVLGIQIATIIAAAISVVLGIIMIRSELRPRYSWRFVKHVLVLSYPMIPASLVPWVLNSSNRLYLNHHWGLTETGLFAVGYKIGMLGIVMLVNAFQLAWSPLFYSSREDEDAPRLCANVFKYYVLVLSTSGLMLSIFAPEILRVIGSREYWDSAWIVPFVSVAYILYGAQLYAAPLFIGANKTKWLAAIMIGIAAIMTVLNIILIPRYGAIGAVAATVTTFFVWVTASLTLANRFYPVPYPKWDFVKLIVSAGITYALYSRISGVSMDHALLKLTSLLCFAILLLTTRFFGSKEMAIMQNMPGRMVRRLGRQPGKNA